MSMVLALSGSVVGRTYLAQQHTMVQDLLSLLHTSTPRVQRQVIMLFNIFIIFYVCLSYDLTTVIVPGYFPVKYVLD